MAPNRSFWPQNELVARVEVMLRSWRAGGGNSEIPLSPILQVVALVVPSLVLVVTGLFLWAAARSRQTQVGSEPGPEATAPAPTDLAPLIQSFSTRLAAAEGQSVQLVAGLQAVASLQARVAALEVLMPSVQEAFEKYADQTARADKRNTERVRRADVEEKKFQTAGDAAAGLLDVAGGGGNEPLPAQPAASQNNGRAGVLGQGGRGKF